MPKHWIFVIGCYNSGTSLLEQLFHQHPLIAGLPGEGQFLTDALVTPKSVGVPRLWAEKEYLFRFQPTQKVTEAQRVQADWLRQLDKQNTPFAIEKSPTNTARTLWLQHHFADPYFIHIVRNGYAVTLGIHKKVLTTFGDMPQLLHKAANQWKRSLEVVREDSPKLKHFMEIRYEDLVEVTTQICRFLNISPLPPEVFIQEYDIHGLHSVIKNQNSERLEKITPEQAKIIYDCAGKLLDEYGYAAKCLRSTADLATL